MAKMNVGAGFDAKNGMGPLVNSQNVKVAGHGDGCFLGPCLFGDLHAYGSDAVRFCTKRKTITSADTRPVFARSSGCEGPGTKQACICTVFLALFSP